MFELDKAIKNWRSDILQNQSILESDADELENHVRDEVESLKLAGLNEEEAYIISTHRIGDDSAVAEEFAKVNVKEVWRNRVFWMLSGVFVFMIISLLSMFLSHSSKWVLSWLNVNPSINGYISVAVHIMVFVGAVFILVSFLGNISLKILRHDKTFRLFIFRGILLIVILKGLLIINQILYARCFGARDMGEALLSSQYVLFGWQIVWPIILVVLLLWLRPSKSEPRA